MNLRQSPALQPSSFRTLLRPKPKRSDYFAPPVIRESPVPKEALHEPVMLEVLREAPSQAPALDEPFVPERKLEWLPWMMGVALTLAMLGSMGYWLMDRASTHSAIAEANRLEPPVPLSLPATTPLPTPSVALRDRMNSTNDVHPTSPRLKKRSFISLIRIKARAAVMALENVVENLKALFPAKSPEASRIDQGSVAQSGRAAALSGNTSKPGSENAVSQGIQGMTTRSVPLDSSDRPGTFGSAGGSASKVSGVISSLSSWLQKMTVPMALFKSAAAVAGESGGVPAGQAGVPTAQAGAGIAAANTVSPLAALSVGTLPRSNPSAAPASAKAISPYSHHLKKAGISKSPAPGRLRRASPTAGRASHHAAHGKPKNPHPSEKYVPHAAAERPDSAAATIAERGEPSQAPPPVHLPGLAASPSAAIAPEVPPVDNAAAAPSPAERSADPWAGRQSDAIKLVVAKILPGSKMTVGGQAKTMLKQMHEKELMHAAETGERLYLPDKMAWAALQEVGIRYRVYLNFLAMQANGERIQARSYQFIVDLKSKTVHADDSATEQDLLSRNAELDFKHNPMATDIDSILGGVDTYNKHQVQMIIIKKNKSNREERRKIETALKTAQAKIQRSIMYFRRTYSDKALQNVAKAYNFMELLKG